jgi:tRNA U34 5-carboxymethylaminomethyl modifying enzyme MnmG/GidA
MSDNQSAAGGAADQSSGAQDQVTSEAAQGSKDQVSYDTYRKTVSEAKKLKEALRQKEEMLALAEHQKLEAEGKKDELIQQLKLKADKLEKEKNNLFSNFVYSSLDQQLRDEAAKLGCIDSEALSKLVDVEGVDVDPKTFKADRDQLVAVIEEVKKARPYLFQKGGPKINAQLPSGQAKQVEHKELKDMSKEELWAELKRIKMSGN